MTPEQEIIFRSIAISLKKINVTLEEIKDIMQEEELEDEDLDEEDVDQQFLDDVEEHQKNQEVKKDGIKED